MAIYRQVPITIWQDDFVGDILTEPPEKLFWAYLLTNSHTTQCGVYPFRMRQAQFDTGLTQGEIQAIIDKLVSHGKVKFSTENNEILIVNWLKFNSARSPKVAVVIDKELKNIKTLEFESEVIMKCNELKYPIKTKLPNENSVSIPYRNPIDTGLQPEPEPEPTQNHNHNQKQAETPAPTPDVYTYYQEAFGVLNSFVSENLTQWVKDLGDELVVEAMKRAALDQKGFRYAEGIMKQWAKKNLKTIDDVNADDVRFNNASRPKRGNVKQEPTPDWAKPGYEAPKEEKTPEQEAEQAARLKEAMDQVKQGRKE